MADIDQHRPMIIKASNTYGISPSVLSSIVIIESNGNPWTFNVDGEGMSFNTKQQAVNKFNVLVQNRWLVKYKKPGRKTLRLFFKTRALATQWIETFRKEENDKYSFLEKKLINVKSGQIVLRKLNLVNTDIGLSQINFKWHGKQYKDRFNFYQWLNPELNLHYAAKHLKELYKRHGNNMSKAVAHYHSSTSKYQKIYMRKFIPVYKREDANLRG
jgi:hypothetical protein